MRSQTFTDLSSFVVLLPEDRPEPGYLTYHDTEDRKPHHKNSGKQRYCLLMALPKRELGMRIK